MEAGAAPGRSAGGDRYGRERCRALDIAARIVFGVSVMDRQIEEYLVDRRKLERGTGAYKKHVQKVHKMDFGARMDMARKYGMEENNGTLLDDIREVRAVRNTIAHSTLDVNEEGTVKIGSTVIDEVVGRPAEYNVGVLREALKKTESCNGRLSAAFGHSRKSKIRRSRTQ